MPRRYAILLAALVCALWGAGSAYAQPIDSAGYLRLLREAHVAAARGDRIGLELVAPALVAVDRVALPGGGSAPADNRWLAQALARPQPDLPAITARLGALIEALAPPASAPAADAEERLRAILARPPFDQPEPPREPGWLERFLQWLADLFDGMVQPVGQAAERGGSEISWLLAIVGLLITGVVLTVWLRGLGRALAPAARLPDDDPEAQLLASEASQRARDLARAGDYRRATRMLYLSALLWLDERGKLRYNRTLTNREYLGRLEHNPALREQLLPVVETFDQVWYGGAPLDAAGFAAYERQVESLRDGSSFREA